MNKKLLAFAVAAAFAVPMVASAADSTVTIYGQMNASVDRVSPGAKNGGDQSVTQVSSNQSRLGFKGTEALGNGLTAAWQIESLIAADGNSAAQNAGGGVAAGTTLGQRNTFVGLAGGFGTAVLGRHDTPYKISTRALDLFQDNIADNRTLMGVGVPKTTTFDGRQSDVIAYISPTMSGFTGAIAYVAGAEMATVSNQKKGDAWSGMVNYANGPIYAALAYERHNVGDLATGSLGVGIPDRNEHAVKAGLGYTMDAFKINAVYEKTGDDLNAGANMCGHSAYYLGGSYTMGSNAIKLAYTRLGDIGDNNSDSGAKQWAVGVDHNMSKRTSVYALYTKLNNDTKGSFGLTGQSDGGVTTNAGGSPSALSFGMKHSF